MVIFNLDADKGSFTSGEYMDAWKRLKLKRETDKSIEKNPNVLKYWIATVTKVNPMRLQRARHGEYRAPYPFSSDTSWKREQNDWYAFDYIDKKVRNHTIVDITRKMTTIDIYHLRIGKKIRWLHGYRNHRFWAFCKGFYESDKEKSPLFNSWFGKPSFYQFILSSYYKKGKESREKDNTRKKQRTPKMKCKYDKDLVCEREYWWKLYDQMITPPINKSPCKDCYVLEDIKKDEMRPKGRTFFGV